MVECSVHSIARHFIGCAVPLASENAIFVCRFLLDFAEFSMFSSRTSSTDELDFFEYNIRILREKVLLERGSFVPGMIISLIYLELKKKTFFFPSSRLRG